MSAAEASTVGRPAVVWKLLVFAALTAAIIAVLWEVGTLVKLVVVSALLAYILDPVVVFFESRGMGRLASTAIVFLLLLVFLGAALALVAPTVADQINALKTVFTSGQANAFIKKSESYVNLRLTALGAPEIDIFELWRSFVVDKVNHLLGYVINIMSVLSSVLLVPFITFLLLTDGRTFKKKFVSAVPNRYFEFTLNLLYKMDRLFGNYLRGVFLESLIIAVMAVATLWAMDVKYFMLLGVVIGLTNIVPYFGPVLGAIPAVLVALVDSGDPYFALYVTLALTAIQIFDNAALKPLLLARMVDIHPLTVLLVVIIGGKFFGVFGMLLSVPATAIIKMGAVETLKNYRRYFRIHPPACAAVAGPLQEAKEAR